MFDPAAAANSKAGKAAKKKAIQNIKDWSTDLVPQELRTGAYPIRDLYRDALLNPDVFPPFYYVLLLFGCRG